MVTIILVVLLVAVTAAMTLFITLSYIQDKSQDKQNVIDGLQAENLAVKEQSTQIQEQFRITQEQWQQRWRQVEERYRPIMDLEAAIRALEERYQARDAEYRAADDQWQQRFKQIEQTYGPFVSLDNGLQRMRLESEQSQQQHTAMMADRQREWQALSTERSQFAQQRLALVNEYQKAKAIYDRLLGEVRLLEENLEDISYGLYKPHFNFDTSEAFRRELERVRDAKKQLARDDRAVRGQIEWHVGGSRAEGVKMQKQLTKLMLRAFNGECDAAIANCRWNNVTRMEERIKRSFTAVNQLGTVVQVAIAPEYLDLALQELQLEFEYEDKKRAEAEEQRVIKERMREEERAQREFERAEAEAIAEERRYEAALVKARAEMATAQGQKLVILSERVQELQQELAAAHAKHERAVSMAQLTRCGYVYIISNLGSFGDDMYKIGLTRRLEPMDRIRELGDASVPFSFDVHALVYSEDAPALESALHQHFRNRNVNLVNPRKEFFYVTLNEIQAFLASRGLNMELTKLAEAREYRETLTLRAKANGTPTMSAVTEAFPAELVTTVV